MTASLRLAIVVLGVVSVAGVGALHLLRPELGPTGHRLSEYANGPYGYVMTAVFLSVGAALLALGLALLRARDRWRWSWLVTVTLSVAGVGMVVSGLYPTEPDGAGTTTETIHSRASAVATLALIAAAIGWSLLRPASPRGGATETSRRPRDGAAVLAIIAVVLGSASPLLHRSAWTGLSQRLLWLTLLVWLIVTAWAMTPPGRPTPSVSGADSPGRVARQWPVSTSADDAHMSARRGVPRGRR